MRRLRRERTVLLTTRLIAAAAAIAAAIAAVMSLLPGVARAADKVMLGGGAGIVVFPDTLCTLTAIGNDNRGNLIGFTSAHCGGPGARVEAEGATNAGVLGTMVAGNDTLDYAVIQFDPQKVQPVNNVKGFEIDGLGPDPMVKFRRSGYFTPFTAILNVTGQPAIALPLYQGDDGLPLAVQVIGPPAREDVLLRLAMQLEEALPWAERRPALAHA
jgi:hypothetical protein